MTFCGYFLKGDGSGASLLRLFSERSPNGKNISCSFQPLSGLDSERLMTAMHSFFWVTFSQFHLVRLKKKIWGFDCLKKKKSFREWWEERWLISLSTCQSDVSQASCSETRGCTNLPVILSVFSNQNQTRPEGQGLRSVKTERVARGSENTKHENEVAVKVGAPGGVVMKKHSLVKWKGHGFRSLLGTV